MKSRQMATFCVKNHLGVSENTYLHQIFHYFEDFFNVFPDLLAFLHETPLKNTIDLCLECTVPKYSTKFTDLYFYQLFFCSHVLLPLHKLLVQEK